MQSVRDAIVYGKAVRCGAYRKVRDLVVEDGKVVSFTDDLKGWDHRSGQVSLDLTHCHGCWLYGCSVVAPVERLLQVNGWPEFCDGVGHEDCVLGDMLERVGCELQYDRKMMTYESQELHFIETAFRKTDKGISPNDKSHATLSRTIGRTSFDYPIPMGSVRALRSHVLSGNYFPIPTEPVTDWWDGEKISEMK
jgi:hypothetical protein